MNKMWWEQAIAKRHPVIRHWPKYRWAKIARLNGWLPFLCDHAGAGDKEKAMTGITAKKGTVEHMAAMGTLTFDGI